MEEAGQKRASEESLQSELAAGLVGGGTPSSHLVPHDLGKSREEKEVPVAKTSAAGEGMVPLLVGNWAVWTTGETIPYL